jgi:predicted anti-sigma-YlaC factor YlaD
MRRRHFLASRCERARALGSARLDGPLSELERADLERHLGECHACRQVVDEMSALTDRVRTAPLRRAPLRTQPQMPARSSRRRRLGITAGVAAAAATAAAMGALAATPWHGQQAPQQRPHPLVVAQRTTHFPWPALTGVAGPQLRSGKR